jgi:hypothetical protein
MLYEFYDTRDAEPRRTWRAKGPFELESDAIAAAKQLNDSVQRATGTRPFKVGPFSNQEEWDRQEALRKEEADEIDAEDALLYLYGTALDD